jgi:predicted RNA binding protein YcfA (HicA-like mRNA interferase family)
MGIGLPRKIRQLKAELRKLGFVEDTRGGKGSHTKWTHPLIPGVTVLIAGHEGDDADYYQERQVCKAIDMLRALS